MSNPPAADVIGATLAPLVLAIVGSAIHGARRRRTGRNPLPAAILWWMAGLMLFAGPAWLSFWIDLDYFAARTGYATSPFQFEVSGINLATLVTLAISLRVRSWRLPIVVTYGIYVWVAAAGHIYQWFANGDRAAGNGPAIWIVDIVLPLGLALLLLAQRGGHSVERPRAGRATCM